MRKNVFIYSFIDLLISDTLLSPYYRKLKQHVRYEDVIVMWSFVESKDTIVRTNDILNILTNDILLFENNFSVKNRKYNLSRSSPVIFIYYKSAVNLIPTRCQSDACVWKFTTLRRWWRVCRLIRRPRCFPKNSFGREKAVLKHSAHWSSRWNRWVNVGLVYYAQYSSRGRRI